MFGPNSGSEPLPLVREPWLDDTFFSWSGRAPAKFVEMEVAEDPAELWDEGNMKLRLVVLLLPEEEEEDGADDPSGLNRLARLGIRDLDARGSLVPSLPLPELLNDGGNEVLCARVKLEELPKGPVCPGAVEGLGELRAVEPRGVDEPDPPVGVLRAPLEDGKESGAGAPPRTDCERDEGTEAAL